MICPNCKRKIKGKVWYSEEWNQSKIDIKEKRDKLRKGNNYGKKTPA